MSIVEPVPTGGEVLGTIYVNARALLDRGKERARNAEAGGSPDGHFRVAVPAWDDPNTEAPAFVTLRRLSFAQVARAMQAAQNDPVAATRQMMRESFVDPPFTSGEVDDLWNDPDHFAACALLAQAVDRINKTTVEAQAATAATFQADLAV